MELNRHGKLFKLERYRKLFILFYCRRAAKASGPSGNRQKGFLGGYLARYMFLKKVKELDQDPLVLFFMLARDLYDPSAEGDFTIETEGVDEEEEDSDYEFN